MIDEDLSFLLDEPVAIEEMTDIAEIDVDIPMGGGMQLRPYQIEALQRIESGWKTHNRQLLVFPGGAGKTIVFSQAAKTEVGRGGKVLIIAHSEELLDQAADKLRRSTGIESEREKADAHATLSASVVIASVQTLSRESRLLGFPDDHFSLVICDECHRSLSASHQKVMCYFHFGERSLDPDWVMPIPGADYKSHAKCLGVTATPSRGDRKSLGEFYQSIAMDYGLLDAVRDGYLVRPIVKNIPLRIDMKAHSAADRVMKGNDYNPQFIEERITPLLREIAREIVKNAGHLKTICFLPGVRTAQLLAEALAEEGLDATFVSGACEDREEKMQYFRDAGPGSVLTNALLVVEGVDIPDVDCVCILRPTKIWSFYVQAVVRGTRTLPGVLDGLNTKEQRLAAIGASAKPFFTVLDFLWLSDKIDLIQPIDIVATRPDLRQKMAEAAGAEKEADPQGTLDIVNLELTATKDLLKSLESAARKAANRAARTVDPLVWAVSLGDEALAVWEPQTAWDRLPATKDQLNFIRGQHIEVAGVKYRGHANKIIVRLLSRLKQKLATPLQLSFMRQLGIPEDKAMVMTIDEASRATDATLAEKKARRANTSEVPA